MKYLSKINKFRKSIAIILFVIIVITNLPLQTFAAGVLDIQISKQNEVCSEIEVSQNDSISENNKDLSDDVKQKKEFRDETDSNTIQSEKNWSEFTVSENFLVGLYVSGNHVDVENNRVVLEFPNGLDQAILPNLEYYAAFADGKVIKLIDNGIGKLEAYLEEEDQNIEVNYRCSLDDSNKPNQYSYRFVSASWKGYDEWYDYFERELTLPEKLPQISITKISNYKIKTISRIKTNHSKFFKNMKLTDYRPTGIIADFDYKIGGNSEVVTVDFINQYSLKDNLIFQWAGQSINTSVPGVYKGALRLATVSKVAEHDPDWIFSEDLLFDLEVSDISVQYPNIIYDDSTFLNYYYSVVVKESNMSMKINRSQYKRKIKKYIVPDFCTTFVQSPELNKISYTFWGTEHYGIPVTIKKPNTLLSSTISSIRFRRVSDDAYIDALKEFDDSSYENQYEEDGEINIPLEQIAQENSASLQYKTGDITFRVCVGAKMGGITSPYPIWDYYDYYGGIYGDHEIEYLDKQGNVLAVVPFTLRASFFDDIAEGSIEERDFQVENANKIGGKGFLRVECKSNNSGLFEYYDTKQRKWIFFDNNDDLKISQPGISIALDAGRSYSVRKFAGSKNDNIYKEFAGKNFVIHDVLDFRILKKNQTLENAVLEDDGNQIQFLDNVEGGIVIPKGTTQKPYESFYTSASATPTMKVEVENTQTSEGKPVVAKAFLDQYGALCIEGQYAGTGIVSITATDNSGIYVPRTIRIPFTVTDESLSLNSGSRDYLFPSQNYQGSMQLVGANQPITSSRCVQVYVNNRFQQVYGFDSTVMDHTIDFTLLSESFNQRQNIIKFVLMTEENGTIIDTIEKSVTVLEPLELDKSFYETCNGYLYYNEGESKTIQLTSGFTDSYYDNIATVKVAISDQNGKKLQELSSIEYDIKDKSLVIHSDYQLDTTYISITPVLEGYIGSELKSLNFILYSNQRNLITKKLDAKLVINDKDYNYDTIEDTLKEDSVGISSGKSGRFSIIGQTEDNKPTDDLKKITYTTSHPKYIRFENNGEFTIIKAPLEKETVVKLSAKIVLDSGKIMTVAKYLHLMSKPKLYEFKLSRSTILYTSVNEYTMIQDSDVFDNNLYSTTIEKNIVSAKNYLKFTSAEDNAFLIRALSPNIADVLADGSIISKKPGNARIRIQAKDDFSKYVDIVIKVSSEEIIGASIAFKDHKTKEEIVLEKGIEFVSCEQKNVSTVYAALDYESVLDQNEILSEVILTTKKGEVVSLKPTKIVSDNPKSILIIKDASKKPVIIKTQSIKDGMTTLTYSLASENNEYVAKMLLYVYKPDYSISASKSVVPLVKGGYVTEFLISSPARTMIREVENQSISINSIGEVASYSIEQYGDGNRAVVKIKSNTLLERYKKGTFINELNITLLDPSKASDEILATTKLPITFKISALKKAKINSSPINILYVNSLAQLELKGNNVAIDHIAGSAYFDVISKEGKYFVRPSEKFVEAGYSEGKYKIQLQLYYEGNEMPQNQDVEVKLFKKNDLKCKSDQKEYKLTNRMIKETGFVENSIIAQFKLTTSDINIDGIELKNLKTSNIESYDVKKIEYTISENNEVFVNCFLTGVILKKGKLSGSIQPVFEVDSEDLLEEKLEYIGNKIVVKKQAEPIFSVGKYFFDYGVLNGNEYLFESEPLSMEPKCTNQNMVTGIIRETVTACKVPYLQNKEVAKACFEFSYTDGRVIIQPTDLATKSNLKKGNYVFEVSVTTDAGEDRPHIAKMKIYVEVREQPVIPKITHPKEKISVYDLNQEVPVEIAYQSSTTPKEILLETNPFYELIPNEMFVNDDNNQLSFKIRPTEAVIKKERLLHKSRYEIPVTILYNNGKTSKTRISIEVDKTKPRLDVFFEDNKTDQVDLSIRDFEKKVAIKYTLNGALLESPSNNEYCIKDGFFKLIESEKGEYLVIPILGTKRYPTDLMIGKMYSLTISTSVYNYATGQTDAVSDKLKVIVKK